LCPFFPSLIFVVLYCVLVNRTDQLKNKCNRLVRMRVQCARSGHASVKAGADVGSIKRDSDASHRCDCPVSFSFTQNITNELAPVTLSFHVGKPKVWYEFLLWVLILYVIQMQLLHISH
jgi:hypothetical protein